MNKIRTVFMGSPNFGVPTLRALAAAGYNLVGVVSQPDRPAGRGNQLSSPPVKVAADELGIAAIQPQRLRQPEATQQLQAWAPDLIVVAAFGQILRSDLLELPRHGCLNVHASLLPRWRGAAPIQACILAGDEQSGVTIMQMDSGIDTGPTLAQKAIRLAADETGGSLFERMASLGADLLLETLPRYLSGELVPQPQPAEGATYASILKKEDGLLDFNRPALELERRVRAMSPWPGAFFLYDGGPLKIRRAHVAEGQAEPAKRIIFAGQPALGTTSGLLVLDELQPAGKKSMPGKAFLAGARNWLE
ncbi:MAG: methionyl-tRNA formyltransferase [Anaerolineales bacterium]|jgi:methionyl-tRNA formyltransferase|nr:methionyl-tRNA formyltransferase [Anaerolineales bacterium]